MEVRQWGRTLEHRQLPFPTSLVEAQNVQIAVVAFQLEVAIVWSVPPIDVFDDLDLARIEPKAHWHSDAAMVDQRSTRTRIIVFRLARTGDTRVFPF